MRCLHYGVSSSNRFDVSNTFKPSCRYEEPCKHRLNEHVTRRAKAAPEQCYFVIQRCHTSDRTQDVNTIITMFTLLHVTDADFFYRVTLLQSAAYATESLPERPSDDIRYSSRNWLRRHALYCVRHTKHIVKLLLIFTSSAISFSQTACRCKIPTTSLLFGAFSTGEIETNRDFYRSVCVSRK